MNTSILIRPYRETDRDAVLHLFRLNTPLYFHPKEEQDLEEYLDRHREYYFVIEQYGNIAGCGGYNISGDKSSIRISWDFLSPGAKGRGLGGELLRFRIRQLEPYRGKALLMVRTSQMAYRFYEKGGFELKEVVTDYWAPGFDLYRMEHPAF